MSAKAKWVVIVFATLVLAALGYGLYKPTLSPNTGAFTPGGADLQNNMGSTVNNPSLSVGPNAQRNPATVPPTKPSSRAGRAGEITGPSSLDAIEGIIGRSAAKSERKQKK